MSWALGGQEVKSREEKEWTHRFGTPPPDPVRSCAPERAEGVRCAEGRRWWGEEPVLPALRDADS